MVEEGEFETNRSRHAGPQGFEHRQNWPKLWSCNDLNVIVLSVRRFGKRGELYRLAAEKSSL